MNFLLILLNQMVLTEPPMNPKANREKMGEIMFEAFAVPGVYVGMQALLALFSEGLQFFVEREEKKYYLRFRLFPLKRKSTLFFSQSI
jgi:hypothetical protein